MALIICTECGKEISNKAVQCIHCGCPIEKMDIENNEVELTNELCPICKKTEHVFSDGMEVCKVCGFCFRDIYPKKKSDNVGTFINQSNTPKCPTCGSTKIRPISGTKRAASILGFGILSKNIGKTYECLNCKYKW